MTDSIFDLNGDLTIDFSSYEIDMQELSLDRLLYQFQNSPVLLDVNAALAAMEQETFDAALNTLRGRTIADAEGANLDVIGVIVGQPRILLNADTKAWFTPDTSFRPDATPVYTTNAPLFGNLPATDEEYRRLILAKIFKNHVKAGSVPEVIQFVELLAGENCSVFIEAPMDISLAVPSSIKPNDVRTIITVFDDKTVDRKYLIPLPTTARLINIWYRPPSAFAPDRLSGRPDLAALSLRVPVSTIGSFL
jgi:hypothetical protein